MSGDVSGYLAAEGGAEGGLASWWACGSEDRFEGLADALFEGLSEIDANARAPEGTAEAALRGLVLAGETSGPVTSRVMHLVLAHGSPPARLHTGAWDRAPATALADLDAALTAARVPRNALLAKLRKPLLDGANRPIVPASGALVRLPGHARVTAEQLWTPALDRLSREDAERVRALLGWWAHATTLWAQSRYQTTWDLVLALG